MPERVPVFQPNSNVINRIFFVHYLNLLTTIFLLKCCVSYRNQWRQPSVIFVWNAPNCYFFFIQNILRRIKLSIILFFFGPTNQITYNPLINSHRTFNFVRSHCYFAFCLLTCEMNILEMRSIWFDWVLICLKKCLIYAHLYTQSTVCITRHFRVLSIRIFMMFCATINQYANEMHKTLNTF